jgi:hypothetical protein
MYRSGIGDVGNMGDTLLPPRVRGVTVTHVTLVSRVTGIGERTNERHLCRRLGKDYESLVETGEMLLWLPMKPKWMRWTTDWRNVEACRKADGQVLKFLVADSEKILRRRFTS